MESPLEPVAELADGAVFRLNPDFDSAGARRLAYDALVAGEPMLRADFDVYLSENRLVYVRESCAPADAEPGFFVHLFPADVNDLPRQRQRNGFDNRDFRFGERGVILDGKCLAAVALPDYDIIRIRTGQYVYRDGSYNNIWETDVRIEW